MGERNVARATDRYEKKREDILDAATVILNQLGVKGLTLSVAAGAVGLSTTSVTYYFKRKDDLAAACLMRGVDWLAHLAESAQAIDYPAERLALVFDLHLDRLRLTATGQAPPLPVLSDIRALNQPRRGEVFAAYMKAFRRMRQIFDASDLAWLTRGRRTARTHMLLEQIFWSASWLPKYDPEDYPRIRERMCDILLNGLAVPGAEWAPKLPPMSELAPGEGLEMSRDAFLRAATRLINTHGYKGASVDRISAELNVTKGSFYHHNEAKDDLVVTCFERSFEVMRRVQRLAMARDGDQWSKLSSAAAALAEYQLSDYGPLLRSSALSALPEPIRREMGQDFNRVSDRFASMISDGIAEGSIRPVDPFIAAQMLAATLNAGAELAFWVPGVRQKAAPAVFVRPMLMGVFKP